MSEKEKENAMRTITMSTKMDVPISLGAMEYIAGIDPKETWAPYTGEDVDDEEFQKVRNKHMELVAQREKTPEFQEKLKKYMEECMNLYQGLMRLNGDIVKPYIDGRTFNFVLGMPRTGGTTLYQALSDSYEWPWEKLLLSMTHNYMPNGRYCLENSVSEFDMGWRLPWNFSSLLFELCQFLVYVNNEAPDSEDIFLKSTALSYAVKYLNFLFGDRANYFVTVRHPGAITLTSGADEITREDHMKTASIWANLYSSIIRDCRPLGKVFPVEYGENMTGFINSVYEAKKIGTRLEDTAFFEFEDYDKEFYESEGMQGMFEYVRKSWDLFDLEFPTPDKCI